MKRICFIIAVLICFSSMSVFAADIEKGFVPSTETEITAAAVYLKNIDTGEVMYEKNADKKLYPASLTKMMTVVLALENTADIDTEMVVYPIEVQDYLYEYQLENGAVSVGRLIMGEERTMREYIYASMLPSANEAAMSIGVHVSGNIDDFVSLMNERAKELGMTGTNFTNTTGLFDEKNYTTARDMAILAEHAMTFDAFREIMSTYKYEAGPSNKQESLEWVSTIELQNPELKPGETYYCEGISGVKTGTLPESGHNYISTISKDGFRYMLIILGADLKTEKRAFIETKAIYDWVFESFRKQTLVGEKEVVGEVPVRFSKDANFVQLETQTYFTALIPNEIPISGSDSQVRKVLDIPESLDAPVQKGDIVGEYIIELSGEEIGRIPLVAKDSLSSSQLLKALDKIKNLSATFWFKFILVLIVLLIIFLIVRKMVKNANIRRKNRAFRTKPPKF